LLQAGQQVDLDQTIAEVEARDLADQQREHSPLVQADDAIPVDSTSMSIDQVLSLMLDHVNRFRSEGAQA
jgi:cytidylate kinase